MSYDIAIIGGGPGGYVAALRASQLGGKVALIERDELGGVCLNRGCIPTKTLLKSAEKWRELQHLDEFGLEAKETSFDFTRITDRKGQVVAQLRQGIRQLLKSYSVDIFNGCGEVQEDRSIRVVSPERESVVHANNLIIATGSAPTKPPIPGMELPGVVTSDEALSWTTVPKRLMVMGGGVVGIELAVLYRSFGSEVTVVEMQPSILPSIDLDLVKRISLVLRKQGIQIIAGTRVAAISLSEGALAVLLDENGSTRELFADNILVATGRRPVIDGLGLENIGLESVGRGLPVNLQMETKVPGVYAVGDATGEYMWAHAASSEGIVAAENCMGRKSSMDYTAMPGCIYITPEVASVGLTEEAAKDKFSQVAVGKFNFAANGKAVSMGQGDGIVKIVSNALDGKVLGMHIFGPHASDLIMEGVVAVQFGITARQLAATVHPHPSLSETVLEAAHGVHGIPLHQTGGRRI